jgi:hypothetical protein
MTSSGKTWRQQWRKQDAGRDVSNDASQTQDDDVNNDVGSSLTDESRRCTVTIEAHNAVERPWAPQRWPTGMRRCVASSRRRCSSRGCSSRGCKLTTLQACGGAPARVAAVRVAASLRRYNVATSLLRWGSSRRASLASRVDSDGASGRKLESRFFFFFLNFFTRQLQRLSYAREKENDNSSTRKRERTKRKLERERKRELWNLFGLVLLNCWFSSSNLSALGWFSITQAPFSKLPPVAPAEQQQ